MLVNNLLGGKKMLVVGIEPGPPTQKSIQPFFWSGSVKKNNITKKMSSIAYMFPNYAKFNYYDAASPMFKQLDFLFQQHLKKFAIHQQNIP